MNLNSFVPNALGLSALIASFGADSPSRAADSGQPQYYELRTYQSPSENKGINKVRMFNSGEVPLMQEVGLSPVFFSRTIIGLPMPCPAYMVSGENRDEHKKHWKGFSDAPAWKKLSSEPQCKDNVSKVISIFLKRTSAPQI